MLQTSQRSFMLWMQWGKGRRDWREGKAKGTCAIKGSPGWQKWNLKSRWSLHLLYKEENWFARNIGHGTVLVSWRYCSISIVYYQWQRLLLELYCAIRLRSDLICSASHSQIKGISFGFIHTSNQLLWFFFLTRARKKHRGKMPGNMQNRNKHHQWNLAIIRTELGV